MRSPPEMPYLFALESAMDELAYALGIDPVELRRINDTKEPIKGLPYTSRALMPCFDAAAKAFGWSGRDRSPAPCGTATGSSGWGCASSMLPHPDRPSDGAGDADAPGQGAGADRDARDRHRHQDRLALTACDRLGVRRSGAGGGRRQRPAAGAGGGRLELDRQRLQCLAKACEDIRARLAAAVPRRTAPAGADPAALILAGGQCAPRTAGRSRWPTR